MKDSFDIEQWNQFLNEIGDDSINVNELINSQSKAEAAFQDIEEKLQEELNENLGPSLPKGFIIDKFEVIKLIGRGGMSSVYLAKRNDGLFDQQVAIKLLAPDLLGDKHISYFDTERKILARLNHANISRILDGGMIRGGIPYLIMEYVEGVSLDKYLDTHQYTLSGRIDIFQKICEAVRHAHGQLILHRDLKPTNVFIDETGSIKLLDFGIGGFIEETYTKPSEGGTIRYMPPEHFTNQEYTVSSDIYQLGLLGYRIFEDKHAINGHNSDEVVRNIKEGNITEWSNIQSNHRLKAILNKCLQTYPEGRYDTVDALIIDLGFYWKNKPVNALPSNWRRDGYLFLKRNKLSAAFSLLLFVLAISFAVWSGIQANRIEKERQKAVAANDFLTEIFRANNPNIHQGDPVTASDLLKDSESKIAKISNNEFRASMNRKLAELYQYLGMYNESGSLLEEALSYFEKTPSDYPNELLETYLLLCTYYEGLDDYPAADSIIDLGIQSLKYSNSGMKWKMAKCLHQKSYILYLMGSYEESLDKSNRAIKLLEEEIRDGDGGGKRKEIASLSTMAWMGKSRTLVAVSSLSEALFAAKNSIEILEKEKVSDLKIQLSSLSQLARVYEKMAKYDSAVQVLEDLLDRSKHAYGNEHTETALKAGNLGAAYYKAEKYSLADSINQLAYAQLSKKFGPRHNLAVSVLYNLANSKQTQGQYEKAAEYYQRVLDADRENLREDHPYIGGDYMTIGMVYSANKQYALAEAYFEKALQNYEKSLGKEHYRVADVYRQLGRLYEEKGNDQAALKWYRQSISITEKVLEPDHIDHKHTLQLINDLEQKTGS